MAVLALRMSRGVNAVSELHSRVSRKMWGSLWPHVEEEDIPIGYVTNGVHYHTWAAKSWKKLYRESFGEGFEDNLSDVDYWQKIYDVPDQTIWDTKQKLRSRLERLRLLKPSA